VKKQTKGTIAVVGFGSLLLFWAAAASVNPTAPPDPNAEVTITGTPADNYPDAQRATFCGTGSAKSNTFIKEYKIPTDCTQPLAITNDPQGNVWFAQVNTGNIAKFDPRTETFTEYENEVWPEGARSMIWGMDYSPDGSIWFTDEAHDSVWRFSIEEENYQQLDFPSDGDSLPQRLQVDGSQIIINDFTGNKITFLEAAQTDEGNKFLSLPSPVNGSFTGGFSVDKNDNLWYTNWIFRAGGVLVNIDQQSYSVIDAIEFPIGLNTPNGLVADDNGNIWLTDTSSNFFFSYGPDDKTFTRYTTSEPTIPSYGNSTGQVTSPISRPYWIDLDEQGRLVFNEQTANRIGIFDPKTETLIEYMVPSKNPNWADCEQIEDCGLAQVFDFSIDGEKIWFTEWVENNIGVLDTSIQLPFQVEFDNTKLTLKKGEAITLPFQVIPLTSSDNPNVKLISTDTAGYSDIEIESDITEFQLDFDGPRVIQITITTNENALTGTHKVLIGAQTDEVTISKYVTVTIVSGEF